MPDSKLARIKREILARPENFKLFLEDAESVAGFAEAIPADVVGDGNRITLARAKIREAYIHIVNSKASDQICQCFTPSIVDCVMAAAQLDLSFHAAMKQAYLVPFKQVCTLMVGYGGYIKLMVSTGVVSHVESVVVYEGEPFEWWRDETGPHWKHEPILELQGRMDKVTACYAVGYLPPTRYGDDQPPLFEPLNRAQLDKIRRSSKQSDGPAYKNWPVQMTRKAPIRRLANYLPQTGHVPAQNRLARAISLDDNSVGLDSGESAREALRQYTRERRLAADDYLAGGVAMLDADAHAAEDPDPDEQKH